MPPSVLALAPSPEAWVLQRQRARSLGCAGWVEDSLRGPPGCREHALDLNRRSQPSMNPSRRASATASVRECAPSLAIARLRCTLTVFSLMYSSDPTA